MKTMIKLECAECGKKFERIKAEHNKNIKLKRKKSFCNLRCFGIYNNRMRPDDFGKKQYEKQKGKFDIKSQAGNRLDEYSSFRLYLGKGRASNMTHKIDVTEKDLKNQWDKQNGICPYTGIKMLLPKTSSQCHNLKSLKKASLDRIDSSKDYVVGNIEFVCMAINLAKRDRTKEEMKSFISEIKRAPIESAL